MSKETIFDNERFYEGWKTHIKMCFLHHYIDRNVIIDNYFEILQQMIAEVRELT